LCSIFASCLSVFNCMFFDTTILHFQGFCLIIFITFYIFMKLLIHVLYCLLYFIYLFNNIFGFTSKFVEVCFEFIWSFLCFLMSFSYVLLGFIELFCIPSLSSLIKRSYHYSALNN
jgi:hypothetical protein